MLESGLMRPLLEAVVEVRVREEREGRKRQQQRDLEQRGKEDLSQISVRSPGEGETVSKPLNGMRGKEESSSQLPRRGGSGRCAASCRKNDEQSWVGTSPWAAGAAATHTHNGRRSVGSSYYC